LPPVPTPPTYLADVYADLGSPELWADVDPNTTADQHDAVQAAIDEAQAGERVCRIPPSAAGIYIYDELTVNPSDPLMFKGCGKEQTRLRWPNDLGAGAVAIRTPKGAEVAIEDLSVIGSEQVTTVGNLPMAMSGLRLEGMLHLRRVRSTSFKAGVEIVNDHQRVHFCDLQGNAYGLLWDHNPVGGLGDHSIVDTALVNQTRASIGIDSSNAMLNAFFGLNGHIGIAPYGIYRFDTVWPVSGSNGSPTLTGLASLPFLDYNAASALIGRPIRGTNIPAGATITGISGSGPWTLTISANATGTVTGVVIGDRGVAMDGVTFQHYSFEYCNHTAIYDEPLTGSFSYVYDPPAESSTGGAPINGPEWTGKPLGLPGVYVGTLGKVHLRGGDMTAQDGRPQWGARQFTDLRVDNWRTIRDHFANPGVDYRPVEIIDTAGAPKFSPPIQAISLGIHTPGSGAPLGFVSEASGAIAQFDLLEHVAYNRVRVSTNTINANIAGVAAHAAADGEPVVVDVEGNSSSTKVRNKSGGSIASGARLKPDPSNAGGVIAVTADGDRSVGIAYDGAIAAGTSGRAWLTVR
jgi:hypothetical protein